MTAVERVELDIQGMTCPTCTQHVQQALELVAGVKVVHVPGWEAGEAVVTAAPAGSTTRLRFRA